MFIQAKIAYDNGDRPALINIREDLIIRIDKDKTDDGRDALWLVTGYDSKGSETGYYITDITPKEMKVFLEKQGMFVPIEKTT